MNCEWRSVATVRGSEKGLSFEAGTGRYERCAFRGECDMFRGMGAVDCTATEIGLNFQNILREWYDTRSAPVSGLDSSSQEPAFNSFL